MPQTSPISFAWWNLGNLHDTQGENFKKLPEGEARKWTGWLDAHPMKLANIASTIRQMNGEKGPDPLGVCEVFERSSLDTLIQKFLHDMGYKVFHHDGPDLRGFDDALLYRPDVLRLDATKTKIHTIMKRVPTRDIMDMHFQVRANREWLTVLGNRWPSRSGGQYETEPFRMMVAENASRVVAADLRGWPKPPKVGRHVPDIMVEYQGKIVYNEVETCETIESQGTREQLEDFSKWATLHVTIPKSCLETAKRVIAQWGVKVETIWQYDWA